MRRLTANRDENNGAADDTSAFDSAPPHQKTGQLHFTSNDPMQPIAWTRMHKNDSGKTNRILTTTMGSASDLKNEGLRRLVRERARVRQLQRQRRRELDDLLLLGRRRAERAAIS